MKRLSVWAFILLLLLSIEVLTIFAQSMQTSVKVDNSAIFSATPLESGDERNCSIDDDNVSCVLSDQTIFLEQTIKRLVIGYLPIIILVYLKEMSAGSATNIIKFIKMRFGVLVSPGTIYPIIYKLESEGKIKRMPKRRRKIYVLTPNSEGKIFMLRSIHKTIANSMNDLLYTE
jgi:hypothetical protein